MKSLKKIANIMFIIFIIFLLILFFTNLQIIVLGNEIFLVVYGLYISIMIFLYILSFL